MKKLQELFNTDIPNECIAEIFDKNKNPTGIYFIPILRGLEMLSKDFVKWGTENLTYNFFQVGKKIFVSGAINLHLQYLDGTELQNTVFAGGSTFDTSVFTNNENWVAILEAQCTKRAMQKIGRKYGMYLNQGLIDMETLEKNKDGDYEITTLSIEDIKNGKK